MLAGRSSGPSLEEATAADNVSIADGKQVITISAKSGFEPRRSVAQAGIPTVIRFTTRGTFDCLSLIRIPSLDMHTVLPHTGTTDIDIGKQSAGVFRGTCGMGVRSFEIEFKS